MEVSKTQLRELFLPSSSVQRPRISQARLPTHIMLGKSLVSVTSGTAAKLKAVTDFFQLDAAQEEMLKKIGVEYPRIWNDISEKLFKIEFSLGGNVENSVELVDVDILLTCPANGLASIADVIAEANHETSPFDYESDRMSNFCPRSIESSVMQRRGFPKFFERLTTRVPVGAFAVDSEHSHDKTGNSGEKVS